MAELPQYDVVIIGSGPGGYVAAIRAGQLGLKAALVEKDDKFGGTCLHWGCIPTKALLFDAEVYEYFKNAREYGILCREFSVDWAAVQSHKNKIVQRLAKGVEFLLKKNNVETLHRYGRLAGPGRVSATDAKNKGREIAAKNIILVTGSEAKMLPGLKPDSKTILTNKEILELKEIPKSMVIIGAGAVGVEFASIFIALGPKLHCLKCCPA